MDFSLSLLQLPSEMQEKSHTQEQKGKKYLNSLELQTASEMPGSHGRCRKKRRVSYYTCPWLTLSMGHCVSWQSHRSPPFRSNTPVTMSVQKNPVYNARVPLQQKQDLPQSAEDTLNWTQHSSSQESSSRSLLLLNLSPPRGQSLPPLTTAL